MAGDVPEVVLEVRRVLAPAPFSCPEVPSDFPLSPSETLCPSSPASPAFLGGCAGRGAGSGLGRKHSSCLAGGSEKLPWKVKSGQHPPLPKPFAPLLVLSALAPGEAVEGMEVAGLSWCPAKQAAACRGRASEAGAEGPSPAQGPAVPPRTTMAETPETRGMGTPHRPLGMRWQWVRFISFLQPHFLSPSTLHAGKTDDPPLYIRTAKCAQRRLQIPPRQAGWAGGGRAPSRWRSGRQDMWKMPRTP